MKPRSTILVAAIVLGSMIDTADATTMVAHRTETEVVIAIDSLVTPVTHASAKPPRPFRACKVFEEREAIFAFSGAGPLAFDARQIVRDALKSRTSVRAAADIIAGRLRAEFEAWLAKVDRQFLQDVARQRIRNREVLLSALVLGAHESDGPVGVAIAFYLGAFDPPTIRMERAWSCDSHGCRDPFVVFGQRENIRNYVRRFRPEALGSTAADRAAGLVQIEIDARTPMVGAPISVAEVGPAGVSWPRPGLCGEAR